jgi:hypothetical protein
MNTKISKMYILIKDNVDLGHAILGAAHASLSGYLTWENAEQDDDHVSVKDYVQHSFRKVVCKVSSEEFEAAKSHGVAGKDYRIMTECALDNEEIAIVFRPSDVWDPWFKGLKLYR